MAGCRSMSSPTVVRRPSRSPSGSPPFCAPAKRTLELALYDIRLPGQAGDLVADELRAAAGRGVAVRLLYNVDSNRPPAIQPPPSTRPELLHELPIEDRAVPGIPDLMHHKYVVRDRESVWTGSANWTTDSWTRQENVVVALDSAPLAAAYAANFDELWERPDVERSGRVEPAPVELGGGRTARAWFTPGHGEQLSQRIATAIGCARRRVRIASPVITSAPMLATLAELGERGGVDIAGVIDEPQTDAVYGQWATNGTSGMEDPAAGQGAQPAAVLGQAIDAVGARDRPRLHAREGDRRRRRRLHRLVQPLALGREERRERARAPRPRARRPDGGVRRRGPRRAIRRRPCPRRRWRRSPPWRRRAVGISKSAGEMRPASSSSARTQSSSPDQ